MLVFSILRWLGWVATIGVLKEVLQEVVQDTTKCRSSVSIASWMVCAMFKQPISQTWVSFLFLVRVEQDDEAFQFQNRGFGLV